MSIERHQDLSYYQGCRAMLASVPRQYHEALIANIEVFEAEVMDAMAEAACTCYHKRFHKPNCPVHGGATK